MPTTTTTLPDLCGNGAVDGTEDCDGTDLAGNDCTTVGQLAGTLACTSLSTFNVEGCVLLHGPFRIRTLKVSRLTSGAGEQRLSLSTEELSVDVPISANPFVEQVTFSLTSAVTILATAVIPADGPRWTLRGRKFKWKAGPVPLPGGLSRVTIGLTDEPFKVKLKLVDFDGASLGSASAVGVTMWIGNDAWMAADKACALSGSGNTLLCR